MAELSVELRNQLEKVVYTARETGEAGARSALRALAVHHYEPYETMTVDERRLRRRLRARGRQLGDLLDTQKGFQEIDCLAHDCAYQHWHRMLFARFLAENGFLIEPNTGVPITLVECHDLAREQNRDPWELAGDAAQRMLPQIFRTDDPALAVSLPPEIQRNLEMLLNQLPSVLFIADDSLGWTYQFWQTDEKKRVNTKVDSGEKVTGKMLPAVTQLFTEHYMVLFLLHNTIGAWYAGKTLTKDIIDSAADEAELRAAVRLDGYDFNYLRFIRDSAGEETQPSGPWRPAAGTYSQWPNRVKDFKILDPCCGSGHFLVAVFDLLVRLRQAEEDIPLEEAIDKVLSENICGLELDPRCTQIAAFNLALAAWKMAGSVIPLPSLNLACSGLSVGVPKQEWLKLANGDERLRWGLDSLYDLFAQAPELGSLLNPRLAVGKGDLFTADFHSLRPVLEKALAKGNNDEDFGREEIGVSAQGMVKAAELLDQKYTLVITNVPYLYRGKQSAILRGYCEKHHPEGKNDLATVFLDRCLAYCNEGGTASLVTPQNWLFLVGYKNFRKELLDKYCWNAVAMLGSGAFETISGEVVKAILFCVSKSRSENFYLGLDVSELQTPADKARYLRKSDVKLVKQVAQLENPRYVFTFERIDTLPYLKEYASSFAGICSGDYPQFGVKFWELSSVGNCWSLQGVAVNKSMHWGGMENAILWEKGKGRLYRFVESRLGKGASGAWLRGGKAWGKDGVIVSQMQDLPVTIYPGKLYDNNVAVVIPREKANLSAIWCFCLSSKYNQAVRKIDMKLNVTNTTLTQVPFDLERWQKIAADKYPNGLPKPFSDDPTQWIFHGHPCGSVIWDENSKWTAVGPLRTDSTVLLVALARLLGYRWPAELDSEMELSDESRQWVLRNEELASFADADGIVCFAPLRGKEAAANRLRAILAASFGKAWTNQVEKELLGPTASLEDWLQDHFFEEHCALFKHRPFLWHIWDGRRDGFNAIVNYHRLAGPDGEGRRTLEALTYSYLGEWIERQKAEQQEGMGGADGRLAAAQDLQEQLQKILIGEPPYDIFVRWKPLHQQPLGWEPDINDGIRLNIRPFMSVALQKGGRAGAGVLRTKPNIKWGKDRGREPKNLRSGEEYPWFWGYDPKNIEHQQDFAGDKVFDGNRWNDLHYSREVKVAARDKASRKGRTDG